MLQRQITIKQLLELQRQQQLQELGNARQQNYTNELSTTPEQNSGAQFPPLINGTAIHDASEMFMAGNMNLVQRHASPVVERFPSGSFFSQAQSQNTYSLGHATQQLDVSLYGTPVASTGNNFSQYSPLQGASYNYANLFTKGNNGQMDKPIIQSLAILNNQCNDSSGQAVQEKNIFGQVPSEGLSSGVLPGNFQQLNTLQRNASVHEYGRKQEKAVWSGLFPGKTTNLGPSEGLASLDPLEQKILFSRDDNNLEASFGKCNDREFENTLENKDCMNAFPSIQSGSWSALMQSAVAEASSSETGMQEEWSGLSFQNPEHSTDNQPSNFVDCGKKQNNWVDNNNLPSAASLSPKPQFMFNDADINLNFHGFRQPGLQFSVKRREGLHADSSYECIHESPRSASKLSHCNFQPNQPFVGSQPVHTLLALQKVYEHLESDAHPSNTSSYANGSQPCINQKGDVNRAADEDFHSAWKAGRDHEAGSFSDSVSGLEQAKSGKVNTMVDREHSQLNNFSVLRKSSTAKVDQSVDQESKLSGESCFQGENSNDSHHSKASQHIITGQEGRDSVWLHGSDSQTVSEANQKPFRQVLCQQFPQGLSSHEQGYVRQFEFIGNVSNNGMDMGKGCLPDSQTSQNMLGLLNKVGMSREHGTGAHFRSTDSTSLTELRPAETPDASPKSYNKSSASPYFGLGLGSPSQTLPNLNFFYSSQSSPQMGNSIATFPFAPPNVRNQLQNQDLPTSPVVYQSPVRTLPGNNSSRDTSPLICANPYGQQFPILEAMQVTQPSITFDSQVKFSPKPSNVWTNTHIQQHLSYTEPEKVSSRWLHSPDSANSSMKTASGYPQELHGQNYLKGVNNSQEIYVRSTNSPGSNSGKEQPGKERCHQQLSSGILLPVSQSVRSSHEQESSIMLPSESNSDASGSLMTGLFPQGLARAHYSDNQGTYISAKDLEAFGHYLRPSNTCHQNYSLLNQANSAKNLETDPRKRVLVRNLANSEQNVESQLNQYPPGNNGMLSFPSGVKGDQLVQASPQTVFLDIPREMANVGQNDHQSPYISSNMASSGIEYSEISFEVEPAWFKQYGSLKNGQVLQMYDAKAAKNAAHEFSLGKPLQNLQMKSSMVQVTDTATALGAINHLSPMYELPSDVTNRTLAILRPKKRKVSAYELVPWEKEVSQSPERLQSISTAELEWAQAANRLVEKVDGESEMIEDKLPLIRPKKRLTMTTQLMQQLFRPAPAVILSADATSNCVNMAYVAARLGLGDACSLTNDFRKPSNTYDMSSEKVKTSEGIGDNNFSEIVQDFIGRAKKLEGDLLRLDKGSSIADLRVESEELEKFSVIARFVKFHSRLVQAGTAETSSSGATSTATKGYPQRYVTAFPMPRTVPEGTPCLSL